jgi:Putative adhesin
MSKLYSRERRGPWIALASLLLLAAPWSLVHAGRTISERRPAEPLGSVEIVNVAGSVAVEGWDRPEVEVTGTAGDQVDRVEVTGSGGMTSIHVVERGGMNMGGDGSANLLIRVPARSRVSATVVSANLKVTGLQGDLKLQSVSGDLSGEAGGDVRASTVSGTVRLTARAAKMTEIKTISGDVTLNGGGGELEVTTVSGDVHLQLATLTRVRLKSISGDLSASLALANDGQLEGESVSGTVTLDFAGAPAADFDVQSISGDIENCFGPKPVEPRHGAGSRLTFKNGDGSAHVRVSTKSGDVKMCDKGAHVGHASIFERATPVVARIELPYII